jgi:hypothetical protein
MWRGSVEGRLESAHRFFENYNILCKFNKYYEENLSVRATQAAVPLRRGFLCPTGCGGQDLVRRFDLEWQRTVVRLFPAIDGSNIVGFFAT